ncbi:hypothetical protein FHR24_002096 [Wenyingzhuangia heitensis]|uniref:Uncharacterized protein n=1 Tax=Wenyingzhuangia heitensis TaxID=1487859 RepID=A0ABX0U9W9_9FLAO|nr:hypothetical protein [Wenyingzhuangia heitensis]NIJ45628.1 hypothetical protein [Wenyingzhuangia heitensis]
MIKNYSTSSSEEKQMEKNKPNTETISFLLAYSKSFHIQKGKMIKELRFDKN